MKRTPSLPCVLPIVLIALGSAVAEESKALDIYFLDMFGGGSTLIVTPLGESVLIDTGSLRPEHRDADRILRACEDAGLKQIDYLVTTNVQRAVTTLTTTPGRLYPIRFVKRDAIEYGLELIGGVP